MSVYGPRDMPRMRDMFAEYVARNDQEMAAKIRGPWSSSTFEIGANPALAVRAAELYYVSKDMCELVTQAHMSMPSYWLQPWDLPSPNGIMYCPCTISWAWELQPKFLTSDDSKRPMASAENGHRHDIIGFAWFTVNGEQLGKNVVILPLESHSDAAAYMYRYADQIWKAARECNIGEPSELPDWESFSAVNQRRLMDGYNQRAMQTAFSPVSSIWWWLRKPTNDVETREFDIANLHEYRMDGQSATCSLDGRSLKWLFAAWNLMKQPLVGIENQGPTRQQLRQAQRSGETTPPTVRVIKLRTVSGEPSNDTGRQAYQHRWMVRGHWRQQWYPSIKDHRPVRVTPHVKGPEGAPMLTAPKVYLFRQ